MIAEGSMGRYERLDARLRVVHRGTIQPVKAPDMRTGWFPDELLGLVYSMTKHDMPRFVTGRIRPETQLTVVEYIYAMVVRASDEGYSNNLVVPRVVPIKGTNEFGRFAREFNPGSKEHIEQIHEEVAKLQGTNFLRVPYVLDDFWRERGERIR